jgi:hypothetical protein
MNDSDEKELKRIGSDKYGEKILWTLDQKFKINNKKTNVFSQNVVISIDVGITRNY